MSSVLAQSECRSGRSETQERLQGNSRPETRHDPTPPLPHPPAPPRPPPRRYFFGGGIQGLPLNGPLSFPSRFGMRPMRVVELGTTTKSRADLEVWCASNRHRFTTATCECRSGKARAEGTKKNETHKTVLARAHRSAPPRARWADDLLRNNCNNFSDALVRFLTDGAVGAPRDVLELPNRFLATPMGQSLAPMIQGLQQRFGAGVAGGVGLGLGGGGGRLAGAGSGAGAGAPSALAAAAAHTTRPPPPAAAAAVRPTLTIKQALAKALVYKSKAPASRQARPDARQERASTPAKMSWLLALRDHYAAATTSCGGRWVGRGGAR